MPIQTISWADVPSSTLVYGKICGWSRYVVRHGNLGNIVSPAPWIPESSLWLPFSAIHAFKWLDVHVEGVAVIVASNVPIDASAENLRELTLNHSCSHSLIINKCDGCNGKGVFELFYSGITICDKCGGTG